MEIMNETDYKSNPNAKNHDRVKKFNPIFQPDIPTKITLC